MQVVQKVFNQVLLPVLAPDLSLETVEKAIAFANQMQCHLHILCITGQQNRHGSFFQRLNNSFKKPVFISGYELAQLEETCQAKMSKGLKLITASKETRLLAAIRSYISSHSIDLVLFCNEIAPVTSDMETRINGGFSAYINCPVLFSSSLPSLPDLKIIVLPVDELLPVNKIRIAIYLAGKFNAVIHLLAMENKKLNDGDLDYLKRAYAVLKENTNQPFVCQSVQNKDLEKAAVEYARSVDAGLVVSRPFSHGSRFPRLILFFKHLFSRKKEVPVMAVN
jgi:hypothetical protein